MSIFHKLAHLSIQLLQQVFMLRPDEQVNQFSIFQHSNWYLEYVIKYFWPCVWYIGWCVGNPIIDIALLGNNWSVWSWSYFSSWSCTMVWKTLCSPVESFSPSQHNQTFPSLAQTASMLYDAVGIVERPSTYCKSYSRPPYISPGPHCYLLG